MWKNITWQCVLNDSSITTLEHPLLNVAMDKYEFENEFRKVLEMIDGYTMADYIEFYFIKDKLNSSHLRFNDEESKEDFYDWAVELGCVLSLKETVEGETNEEKENERSNYTVCEYLDLIE